MSRCLELQHYIYKKLCITVGGFDRAVVFFGDGGNGGKADACSAVFGGTVAVFSLADLSVKIIG